MNQAPADVKRRRVKDLEAELEALSREHDMVRRELEQRTRTRGPKTRK
jgi:hypothetical protein